MVTVMLVWLVTIDIEMSVWFVTIGVGMLVCIGHARADHNPASQ